MISNLRVDQLLMQTNTINKETKRVYEAMIEKNDDFVHNYARNASSMYFIEGLVNYYIKELVERKVELNKLALELLNSKILVWAEIKDDDELSERALLLSAAKANSKFYKYGFHISPTIVEEGDQLEIPKQYKALTLR